MKSDEIDKLVPALIAAQAEFPAIPKDGYNPHFKSRFSSLNAVKAATQPVLNKHGLAVVQFPSTTDDGKSALTTWLVHASGQWMNAQAVMELAKRDPQAQGGAITYLRRYAWTAVLGLVADEDDDGQAASAPAPVKPKTESPDAKAKREFARLIDAAKRAGVSKEEAEREFKENTGHDLSPSPQALEDLTDYADLLVERAVEKEMQK